MSKQNEFKNGAVVMNEDGAFLSTQDEKNLTWEHSTENAMFFNDNEEAEDFLNKWNKENPCCVISGVKIVAAPEENEKIDVCSEKGQKSTKAPMTPCDKDKDEDEDFEDYQTWNRTDIVDEIFDRGLEDMCDTEEDSTNQLRQVLIDNDNEEDEEDSVDYAIDALENCKSTVKSIPSIAEEMKDVDEQIEALKKRKFTLQMNLGKAKKTINEKLNDFTDDVKEKAIKFILDN